MSREPGLRPALLSRRDFESSPGFPHQVLPRVPLPTEYSQTWTTRNWNRCGESHVVGFSH